MSARPRRIVFDPLDRAGWQAEKDATLREALELRAYGGKKWLGRTLEVRTVPIVAVQYPSDLFRILGSNEGPTPKWLQIWDGQNVNSILHDRPVYRIPLRAAIAPAELAVFFDIVFPKGAYEFRYGIVLTASTVATAHTPSGDERISFNLEFQDYDLRAESQERVPSADWRERRDVPEQEPEENPYAAIVDEDDFPDDERGPRFEH